MIGLDRMPSSIALRVAGGRHSIATLKSSMLARPRVRIGFAPDGRRARTLTTTVWAHKRSPWRERNFADEAWRTRRVLGNGHRPRGPASGRARGRAARVRLRV